MTNENKKENKKRMENDFYQTPTQLTIYLIELLEKEEILHPNHLILEPCVGDWSIAYPLQMRGYSIQTNDIDTAKRADIYEDARYCLSDIWLDGEDKVDWVITNPPFNQSAAILANALYHAKIGVAFLLRLSFLEPTEKGNSRRWLLNDYADSLRFIIPINPRPRFRLDVGDKGTDSVTVAWYIWDKTWSWEQRGISCPFRFDLVDWRNDEDK